jgi:hypothetical protein
MTTTLHTRCYRDAIGAREAASGLWRGFLAARPASGSTPFAVVGENLQNKLDPKGWPPRS